ncbi:MAG: cyclophilin-like fold protein [Candidatus Competibacteraceae bacterium]
MLLALIYTISLFAAQPSNHPGSAEPHVLTPSISETSVMKIRLIVNGRSMTATLIDSPTTRDFLKLLPITLTLEDYASTEKIAYLPGNSRRKGFPQVSSLRWAISPTTRRGEILPCFTEISATRKGLIKLGNINDGAEVFNVPGSVTVTIELLAD